MNLVFISRAQYPFEYASTNRLLAYSKGLVELGHKVTFVLFLPQNLTEREFIKDGIHFICTMPGRRSHKAIYRFIKPIFYLQSTKKVKRIIKTIHLNNRIDSVIILPTLIRDLLIFITFARSLKIKLLHERTEYPSAVLGGNKLTGKLRLSFYLYFLLRKFDGIYVINNALKLYFQKITDFKVPVEVINMMVDPGRFNSLKNDNPFSFRYVAYCGNLNSGKDGVDILVEAFCRTLVAGKIPEDIKLLLIGDNSDEDFHARLNNLIQKYHSIDQVIFTGQVGREKVPEILNSASALALARPESKQSEGGFPTKLGEYLATGKPVIVTQVGELGLYLKDGYNAFLARPGDVDSFSGKISEVFSDYPKALEIGMKGRILTEMEFNYLEQAKRLAGFIESL